MVNGSRHKGCLELIPLSLSRLLTVLAVNEAPVARTTNDNDKSVALSATLTIDRSLISVISLDLLLPS